MSSAAESAALRQCPLCGTDNANEPASRFSSGEWVLKPCSNCRLLYLENAPAYEALEVEFAWEKTSARVTKARKAATPVRNTVSQNVKKIRRNLFKGQKVHKLVVQYMPQKPGILVDIGCGHGAYLQKLTKFFREGDLKVIPVGIEISEELAATSHRKFKKLGGRAIQADSLSGLASLEPGTVNGVLMSSYLEHEVKPLEVLKECHRVLKPGGCVVIKVPNFACINRLVMGPKWCGFRYPDHVNYFTPESLKRVGDLAGLEVTRHSFFDKFPTSDNMYIVLRKPRKTAPASGEKP